MPLLLLILDAPSLVEIQADVLQLSKIIRTNHRARIRATGPSPKLAMCLAQDDEASTASRSMLLSTAASDDVSELLDDVVPVTKESFRVPLQPDAIEGKKGELISLLPVGLVLAPRVVLLLACRLRSSMTMAGGERWHDENEDDASSSFPKAARACFFETPVGMWAAAAARCTRRRTGMTITSCIHRYTPSRCDMIRKTVTKKSSTSPRPHGRGNRPPRKESGLTCASSLRR